MRTSWLVAVVAGLLWSAGPVSAQVLSLEFHDGKVRLIAENVPVGRILAEWSRLGGTKILNGERIPGAPVTLQLLDVPERQALDVVLRGAAGYIVAARETTGTGASTFDRILVLPTTSRAPSTASLPPPVAQPAPQFVEQEDPTDGPESPQLPGLPGGVPPGAVNRLPRARVQLPGAQPVNPPQPDGEGAPRPNDTPQAPANPFGVQPGSTRPGVLAPTVPPRNPNEPTSQDR
jgi:hypothetical protein